MVIKSYLLTWFNVAWHIQNIILAGIILLILGLLVYMLSYMYFKSVYDKKFEKWSSISDLLIRKAIFYDDDEIEDDELIPVTARAEKLMRDRHFRKLLVNEIISAKKNITGISADHLKHLYTQLGLEKYALNNLSSNRWFIKAKAVQELTIMDMREFVDQIYAFTDDKNDLVRMEAQSALVQFGGFDGLRFLDTITYPISNWQQIKLLQQLSHLPPSDIDMSSWFGSANSSVIVLALKLARNYHRYELHDAIAACLDHPDPWVRNEAIQCLSEIYTDETADQLISHFLGEILKNQIAMIKVMQTVGSERDALFLLDLLTYDSDEIKICAARALAQSSKNGMESLLEYSRQSNDSISEIVMHIKGETAA